MSDTCLQCGCGETDCDAPELARLRAQVEALEAERDAYKRAKAENDERFMIERDEARIERDDAEARAERAEMAEAVVQAACDPMPLSAAQRQNHKGSGHCKLCRRYLEPPQYDHDDDCPVRALDSQPTEAALPPAARDDLGHLVRRVWVEWAKEQPSPKPSWLVPWEDLPEPDREVDRRIGEAIAATAIRRFHEVRQARERYIVREAFRFGSHTGRAQEVTEDNLRRVLFEADYNYPYRLAPRDSQPTACRHIWMPVCNKCGSSDYYSEHSRPTGDNGEG